jgi:integrase
MKGARWKLNPDALVDDGRFKSILDGAESSKRSHLALMIAGNMGWRIGEVVHIRVEDVDLANGSIKKWVLKKRTKGASRYVGKPIAQMVLPELKKWIGKRTEGWLFMSAKEDTKCDVFSKPKYRGQCAGGHVTKRTMQNAFDWACSQAGLPDVKGRGIHSLRHCFALRVALVTKDPHKVRDLLDQEGIEVAAMYVRTVDQRRVLDDVGGVS